MSKTDRSLNNLATLQRSLAQFADPNGIAAMHRSLSQFADPGGLMAMQRSLSQLADPGGIMAMQRGLAQFADPGGIMTMQRRMAQIVDPKGMRAMHRKMTQFADPSGMMALQRGLSQFADPSGTMALQRSVSQFADPSGIMAMHRRMTQIADPGGIMAMHRRMAQLTGVGALRMTALLSPTSSFEALINTVRRAQSSLLGNAAIAIANAFPRHAQVASETLSALAVLELNDEAPLDAQTLEGQSPLVAAITELRNAIDESRSSAAIEEIVERVVAKLASHSSSPKASAWDLSTIISFVGILIALIFGGATLGLGVTAELRARRQDTQASRSQSTGDARTASVQRSLDRLVELHEQENARTRAVTTDNASAISTSVRYVVERAVALRQRDSMRSPRLRTLFPGTVVDIVERRGRKMQVRYFDHLRGEEQIGWVLKKYLVRLEQ